MSRWRLSCGWRDDSCAALTPAHHMSLDASTTTFSTLFNQLKHLRCRQPVSQDVLDIRSPECAHLIGSLDIELDHRVLNDPLFDDVVGSFSDTTGWRPVFIKSLGPDLIIVPAVLKPESCGLWFDRLLNEYPRQGTGFRSHVDLESVCRNATNMRSSNLRWLTFGYHYQWTPKVYDFEHPDTVPPELGKTFTAMARIMRTDFKPEAGIINYYTCKSRLSPHCDVAEPNERAPLFSLSFGGSAILMVGGVRKEDTPVVPVLLSDGDLVIMRGEKRLSFHAVPKVYCSSYSRDSCSPGIIRININARQVF